MANSHVDQISPKAVRLIATSILVLLTACAASPNRNLQHAQSAYDQAKQNPIVTKQAPVTLHEAEQSLRQAEQTRDKDKVNHLAYLAQRQVEIAVAEANRKAAEADAENRLKERDRILLDARTREAQNAQTRAAKLSREFAELQGILTARGFEMSLGDVLFAYNRADLKPGAQRVLSRLAAFLTEYPEQNILIEGHADSTGKASYNLILSERRAEAVQEFLIANGIDAKRITVQGYGSTYPLASNRSEAGRQRNRRVEIIFPLTGLAGADVGKFSVAHP